MFPSLSGPSWGHSFRRKAAEPYLLSLLGRSGRTSRHESPDRLVDDSQLPSQAAQFSKGSALSLEPQSLGLPWFPLRPPFPPLLPQASSPPPDLNPRPRLHTLQSTDTGPYLLFLVLRHHPDYRDLARAAELDRAAGCPGLGRRRSLCCRHGCAAE